VTASDRLCNVGRLLDTMAQRGLDGIVSYLRPNVFYLSGFAPPASASVHETNGYAAVVISRHEPEHPVIVVAEFDLAHFLQQPSWVEDARPYATLLSPLDVTWGSSALDHFVPAEVLGTKRGMAARGHYAPSLIKGVARAMRDVGLARGTVGFDDLRFAAAVASDGPRVADAYGALKHVRQVKTPDEIRLLRDATRLNQLAIERTIRTWSRGTTWQEMIRTYHTTAVGLGGFVRDPGALVMANPPGLEPALYTQSGSEDFVVEPGMHVMWDCHGTLAHYCWDGGKTWIVDDRPRGEARRIADATALAMDEIQRAGRPGARISELQATGRQASRRRTRRSGLHLLPRAWSRAHRHGDHGEPPGLAARGRHGRLGAHPDPRRRSAPELAGGDLPRDGKRGRSLLHLGQRAHRRRPDRLTDHQDSV
jgi:Xaa-Pro aminopeptidase